MDQERQTTVLFADVSGSTRLYESEGDTAALAAIELCLHHLRQTAESSGGRVVKTIGDEIMAVFPSADAAAIAAAGMQYAIDALAPVGQTKLAVRIGFHCGPVIQSDDDIFGDTVNVAARLVEQALRSQIITSLETTACLGPAFRSFTRQLYAIHVKGKAEEVDLCELIWRHDENMTISHSRGAAPRARPTMLRLVYREREIIRRRDNDSITIGRDKVCGLVIADTMASRQHCTIERRQDKFVLSDQSTNGTFVTAEGASEVLLQREEFTLGAHGWIAFGQSRAGTPEIVEYFCD